jgi:hypothetical protein
LRGRLGVEPEIVKTPEAKRQSVQDEDEKKPRPGEERTSSPSLKRFLLLLRAKIDHAPLFCPEIFPLGCGNSRDPVRQVFAGKGSLAKKR